MKEIASKLIFPIFFILIGISSLSYAIYFSMEINKNGRVLEGTICQQVFEESKTRKGRHIVYYYHEICMDGIFREEPKEDLLQDLLHFNKEIPGSFKIELDKPHPLNEYIKFVHDTRTANGGWDAKSIELNYLLFNYYGFQFILGIILILMSIISLIHSFFNFDIFSKIMNYNDRYILPIYELKLKIFLSKLIDFIKNPKPTISLINQKKETINRSQRNIIGICISLVLLILCIKISIAFDEGRKPSAFNFDRTWIIWLVFLVFGGVVEYYLFSDNSNKEK